MKYFVAAHSDTGIKKQVNQDSLCVKVADTKKGQIVMGVVCDGMGGLKKGELASATVIRAFADWFEKELPSLLEKPDWFGEIKKQWKQLLQDVNVKILNYGINQHISIGTTVTAIFIAEKRYLVFNIGDSRTYRIKEKLTQLTTDQTLVEQEVREKKITREQAMKDPRKSILTQCIGAARIVEPEIVEGSAGKDEVYLLCSDGFRHEIKEEEMLGVLSPIVLDTQVTMKRSIIDLVELNKSRGEKDNISVLLIKTE